MKNTANAWVDESAELDWANYRPFKDKNGKTLHYGANPNCDQCRGSGFVTELTELPDNDFSCRIVPCNQSGCLDENFRNYQQGIGLHDRGVSREYQTFDQLKPNAGIKPMIDNMRQMAEGRAKFRLLLIYGSTGNGKTHGCNAMAITMTKFGNQVKLWTVADLFSHLRQAIDDNTIEVEIEDLKNHSVLILDDWATDYASAWQIGRMEEVIDYRYRHGKKTVLTTNRPMSELPDRIVSRFMEKGLGKIIENKGWDYRMKRA